MFDVSEKEKFARFQLRNLDEMNDLLIKTLQDKKKFYLSKTLINGKTTLRVCIINLRSSLSLIDELLKALEECIHEIISV